MCKVNTVTIGNRNFKVADLKEKYMANIIDAARKCDYITKVVLFGSSTNESCKDSSDIDLAVFGTGTPSKVLESKKYEKFARQLYSFDDHKQAYDILYFREGTGNDSPIMIDIENGEVLYERQQE